MLRLKVCGILLFFIAVTLIDWRISVGIVVALFGLDLLLQKENEENLQEVKDYIASMEEKERIRQKDLRFYQRMKENESGFHRKSKMDTWS